jgi:hypothetical protein
MSTTDKVMEQTPEFPRHYATLAVWLTVAPHYEQRSLASLLRMLTALGGLPETNFRPVLLTNYLHKYANIHRTEMESVLLRL